MNFDADNQIPLSWLIRKVSAQEIKLAWVSYEENLRAKAAGKLRITNRKVKSKRQKLAELQITKINERREQSWNEFMSGHQDEDEIWEYSSPVDYWEKLMGSSGYVRIREGKIFKFINLRMN